MIKRLLTGALGALVLVIVGACAGVPPSDTDWCYFHDFTEYPYSVVASIGEYEPSVGWVSAEFEGHYRIEFELTNPLTVRPAIVEIVADRAPGVSGNTTIDAIANAWGINATALGLFVPALITDGQTIPITPANVNDSSDTFNLDVESDLKIVITGIVTRGYGANPFPEDNCIEPTLPPTVTTPPPIATDTPAPSATPSNTAIPFLAWCYRFDFATGQQGWGIVSESPWGASATWTGSTFTHKSVTGSGAYATRLHINRSLGTNTTITSVSVSASGSWGNNVDFTPYFVIRLTDTEVVRVSKPNAIGTLAWSGTRTNQNYINILAEIGYDGYPPPSSSPGGSLTIPEITIAGLGTNPFGADNCAPMTATPSQTNTPSQTSAYTATSTRTPSRTPTPNYSPTPTYTRTRIPIVIPATGTPSRTSTATGTGSPVPTITPLTPTNTRTPIATNTPFATFAPSTITATSTGTATINPSITPTVTPDPGEGPPGGDQWYLDISGWLEWIVAFATNLGAQIAEIFTRFLDFFNVIVNFINGLSGFIVWLANTILNLFDWLISLFFWVVGTMGNIISQLSSIATFLGAIVAFIVRIIGDLIQIAGMLISIIVNALGLFVQWIGSLITTGESVINAYWGAPVTPIPGFPQCKTNPVASDICAMWYVAKWTILHGTIGQFIVPAITALVDLMLVASLIKIVKAFLKRAEGITKS